MIRNPPLTSSYTTHCSSLASSICLYPTTYATPRPATPRHSTTLRHVGPRHATPHHTSPRIITPHYASPRRTIPRHTAPFTPHHAISHRTRPRHAVPHHATPCPAATPRRATPRHITLHVPPAAQPLLTRLSDSVSPVVRSFRLSRAHATYTPAPTSTHPNPPTPPLLRTLYSCHHSPAFVPHVRRFSRHIRHYTLIHFRTPSRPDLPRYPHVRKTHLPTLTHLRTLPRPMYSIPPHVRCPFHTYTHARPVRAPFTPYLLWFPTLYLSSTPFDCSPWHP